MFFYFFLRHARKTKNFFSKCAQITWKFFPPTLAKRKILLFAFYPPMDQKNSCRTSSTKQCTADALKYSKKKYKLLNDLDTQSGLAQDTVQRLNPSTSKHFDSFYLKWVSGQCSTSRYCAWGRVTFSQLPRCLSDNYWTVLKHFN